MLLKRINVQLLTHCAASEFQLSTTLLLKTFDKVYKIYLMLAFTELYEFNNLLY